MINRLFKNDNYPFVIFDFISCNLDISDNFWGLKGKNETEKKLNDFLSLKKGWYYGEGKSIDSKTIFIIKDLLYYVEAQGFTETDTFPGLNGDVRLTIYYNEYYIEITLDENCIFLLTIEKNDNEIISDKKFNETEIKKEINTYGKKLIWDTLDSSTSATMIQDGEDFKVWDFLTHLMDQEYLLSMNNVQYEPLEMCISI